MGLPINKKTSKDTPDNIDEAMYELVKERRNEPANIPLTEVVEDSDFDLGDLSTCPVLPRMIAREYI